MAEVVMHKEFKDVSDAMTGTCSPLQEDAMGAQAGSRFAGSYGINLLIDHTEPPGVTADAPLLVFLHGNSDDGVVNLTHTGVSMLDWLKDIGREHGVCTVFLQRPGFRSTLGQSGGFEGQPKYMMNRLGWIHLAYVAGALYDLRQRHPQRPLLLVGHSGGSLVVSMMAAHYPQLTDTLVISGYPFDILRTASLRADAPIQLDPCVDYKLIPDTLPIIALGGELDTITPPEMGRRFIELLQQKGAQHASFILAHGHTHSSLRAKSQEFRDAVATQLGWLRARPLLPRSTHPVCRPDTRPDDVP